MRTLRIDPQCHGVRVALTVARPGTGAGILATAHRGFGEQSPAPGMVEHRPEEIWTTCLAVVREITTTNLPPECVRVTAHPAITVFWDPETLGSSRPAIGCADRRVGARERRATLPGSVTDQVNRTATHEDRVRWLEGHEPHTFTSLGERCVVGGVESYLVARMTRGLWHVGLPTTGGQPVGPPDRLGDGLGDDVFPGAVLPGEPFSTTDPRSFLGLEIPIALVTGREG